MIREPINDLQFEIRQLWKHKASSLLAMAKNQLPGGAPIPSRDGRHTTDNGPIQSKI
jgi:hypothetical protein